MERDRLSKSSLLLGLLDLKLLTTLLELGLGLETHDSAAPLALNGLVELSMEVLRESLELGFVLLANLGEGNDRGSLLVGQCAETGLSLDNGEGDIKLAAQGRKPDDELDRINIVGDDDQLGLLLLNEGSDVLKTVLEGVGDLGSGNRLTGSNSGGLGLNAGGLGLLGLRLVLNQELEELSSLVLVESLLELVDGWGDLEALGQDLLLSLKSDVLGPADISGQISGLRSDVTSDAVGLGTRDEKRVRLGGLGNLLGAGLGRSLGVGGLWRLWKTSNQLEEGENLEAFQRLGIHKR
jgi:hypothetical protein